MRIELPLSVAFLATLAGAGLWPDTPSDGTDAPEIGVAVLGPAVLPNGSLGCDVTVTARNTGTQTLKISNATQVRAKPSISPQFGTWKKLWKSNQFVHAGKSWSAVERLDFGCSYVRQYRFRITYGGNEKAFFYPSKGGTKNETVSLGNLYTKFFNGQ